MNLDPTARARLAVIAAGVVLGLAVFEVVSSFVRGLLAPLISVFIEDMRFEMNAFTIESSECQYGIFIEAVLIATVSTLIAYLVFKKSS